MESYPVKENHIGSVVIELIWYRQTDIHTNHPVTYYKNLFQTKGRLILCFAGHIEGNRQYYLNILQKSLPFLSHSMVNQN